MIDNILIVIGIKSRQGGLGPAAEKLTNSSELPTAPGWLTARQPCTTDPRY